MTLLIVGFFLILFAGTVMGIFEETYNNYARAFYLGLSTVVYSAMALVSLAMVAAINV